MASNAEPPPPQGADPRSDFSGPAPPSPPPKKKNDKK